MTSLAKNKSCNVSDITARTIILMAQTIIDATALVKFGVSGRLANSRVACKRIVYNTQILMAQMIISMAAQTNETIYPKIFYGWVGGIFTRMSHLYR